MSRQHDQDDRDLGEHARYLATVLIARGNLHPDTLLVLSRIADAQEVYEELDAAARRLFAAQWATGDATTPEPCADADRRLTPEHQCEQAKFDVSPTCAERLVHLYLTQAEGLRYPHDAGGTVSDHECLARYTVLVKQVGETWESLQLLHASSLGTARARTSRRRTPAKAVKAVLDRVEARTRPHPR